MNKTITTLAVTAISVSMLGGCAMHQVKPSEVYLHIDPISITSQSKMHADVATCTTIANRATKDARKHAIVVGLVGALVGAAAGAAIAHDTPWESQIIGTDAAVGMAVGLGTAVPYARTRQEQIIGLCLRHRGYLLLY